MNQAQTTVPELHPAGDAPELGVINILIVLAKYKKRILGLPLAVGVIAAVISLALPDVYRSTTKLLPPQQPQSGAAALLSQLGGFAGSVAGSGGLKSANDLYIGMLKSRTIADTLIAKHNLKQVYGSRSQEKVRAELEENTLIASGKDGLITIDVFDKDRTLVAPLANTYVEELLKLTRVLAVTEASQRRLFFERQLEQAKNNLASAEVNLKGALDSRGVISVDSQSRAIVETVGRLRAQISAKQIELNSMSAFVTVTNPAYRRAQEELNSLRAELSQLENGRPEAGGGGGTAGKSVGLENIKILRDVKYYQMLYELLAKQYEAARLDEAKENTVVQVLDPAVEPERKFKPKRAIIVLVSVLLALFAAIASVFISETKQRVLRLPGGAARIAELKSQVWSM